MKHTRRSRGRAPEILDILGSLATLAGNPFNSMKSTIPSGQHLAECADISGSKFHNVNLSEAEFNDVNLSKAKFHNVNLSEAEFSDVNLSKAKFHNINLSDIRVTAVQIGGATFKHIGPPPDKDGRFARQRPVIFEEAMLGDSTFRKVDLSNVKIVACQIDGMTIDGILVTDLLEAYRKRM